MPSRLRQIQESQEQFMKTFKSAATFRVWLARNGSTHDELIVRVFKKHAADQGMTYSEALDQALCAGWIDGVRKGQDEDSWTIRFRPRRPRSLWSGVNLKRYQELMAQGRITARGEAAWCDRHPESDTRYAGQSRASRLSADLTLELRAHPAAWKYYQSTGAGYRRAATAWIMGAKRDQTRRRRLEVLIECSRAKKYIPLLRK